jgi:hypothetical protein
MTTKTLTAIVSRFDAAETLKPCNGGLHADAADEGTPYPYCVLQDRGGHGLLRSFDRQSIERPKLRFRVWDTDADRVLSLAEAACPVFDDQRIDLEGGSIAQFTRIAEPKRFKEPGLAEDGSAIWTAWVDYDVFVQA